jgi:hypothetical protein
MSDFFDEGFYFFLFHEIFYKILGINIGNFKSKNKMISILVFQAKYIDLNMKYINSKNKKIYLRIIRIDNQRACLRIWEIFLFIAGFFSN